jgi:hypothetical protein
VCKILQKIGQLYPLLFPCLKVRLLICHFQSNLHSPKGKLPHMLTPLTILLLQGFRADSLYVYVCFFFFLKEKTHNQLLLQWLFMLKDFHCLRKGKPYQITTSLSLGLCVLVFDLITLLCELLVPGPI